MTKENNVSVYNLLDKGYSVTLCKDCAKSLDIREDNQTVVFEDSLKTVEECQHCRGNSLVQATVNLINQYKTVEKNVEQAIRQTHPKLDFKVSYSYGSDTFDGKDGFLTVFIQGLNKFAYDKDGWIDRTIRKAVGSTNANLCTIIRYSR